MHRLGHQSVILGDEIGGGLHAVQIKLRMPIYGHHIEHLKQKQNTSCQVETQSIH